MITCCLKLHCTSAKGVIIKRFHYIAQVWNLKACSTYSTVVISDIKLGEKLCFAVTKDIEKFLHVCLQSIVMAVKADRIDVTVVSVYLVTSV